MNILELIAQTRNDLKLQVINNLRVKLDKNLGIEESGKFLQVNAEGDIVGVDISSSLNKSQIIVSETQPTSQSSGDFWYKICD